MSKEHTCMAVLVENVSWVSCWVHVGTCLRLSPGFDTWPYTTNPARIFALQPRVWNCPRSAAMCRSLPEDADGFKIGSLLRTGHHRWGRIQAPPNLLLVVN